MTGTRSQRMTAAVALLAVLFTGGTASVADTRVQLTFGGDWCATAEVTTTSKIVPRPIPDLQVWIWPDRGEGGDYRSGDDIAMYVEASRDCYLILYNIDTQGRLNILYPYDPWSDNFVRGGETVRFPRTRDGLDWTVTGPPGVEYVQAIASVYPIAPPDWPVYIRSVNGRDAVSYDRVLNDFHAYDDRLAYIHVVNRKITRRHRDFCATDLATFHVRPRRYWMPHHDSDPWPQEFYGEIYIGWPVGGAIWVDDVFFGYAPLRIPRRHWGRHVITCRVGSRVVRTRHVHLYPKRRHRYQRPAYGRIDAHTQGYVKPGSRGRPAHYKPPVRTQSRSEHLGRIENRKRDRVIVRTGKAAAREVDRVKSRRQTTRKRAEKSPAVKQTQLKKARRSGLAAFLSGVSARIGRTVKASSHDSQKAGTVKRERKSKQKAAKRKIAKRK